MNNQPSHAASAPVHRLAGRSFKSDFKTHLPIIDCCGVELGILKTVNESKVCEKCLSLYHSDQIGNIFTYKLDPLNAQDDRADAQGKS